MIWEGRITMPDLLVQILRWVLPMACGWITAQATKMIIFAVQKKPLDLFCSGGMPSTHTSSAIAMITHIAICEHFRGGLFALALLLGIVTAFDACNVRLQCGRVTEKVNAILDKVYAPDDPEKPEKLKVINGHTIPEVLVGALIGIAVGAVYTLIEGKILA